MISLIVNFESEEAKEDFVAAVLNSNLVDFNPNDRFNSIERVGDNLFLTLQPEGNIPSVTDEVSIVDDLDSGIIPPSPFEDTSPAPDVHGNEFEPAPEGVFTEPVADSPASESTSTEDTQEVTADSGSETTPVADSGEVLPGPANEAEEVNTPFTDANPIEGEEASLEVGSSDGNSFPEANSTASSDPQTETFVPEGTDVAGNEDTESSGTVETFSEGLPSGNISIDIDGDGDADFEGTIKPV